MTTAMIMDSIAAWQAIRNNKIQLVSYLGQGNCFTYDNITYPESSDNIHAYPGIYEGELMFFMIPEAYDKAAYAATISDYVQVCPVMWTLVGTHTIPDIEAEIRIGRWIEQYQEWVPKQVDDPVGIFMAFNISIQDFVAEECLVTLGLQLGGVEGIKTADLIIANPSGKSLIQFDDYTEPVPPFSASAAAESFYLLQL